MKAVNTARINARAAGLSRYIDFDCRAFKDFKKPEQKSIIISTPPYVPQARMDTLPSEYRHEPAMALGAGDAGMDVVRRMLPEAAAHLNDGGMIIVEVGDGAEAVEATFPGLEIIWLATSGGDDQVFLVTKEALLNYFEQ